MATETSEKRTDSGEQYIKSSYPSQGSYREEELITDTQPPSLAIPRHLDPLDPGFFLASWPAACYN